MVDNNALLFIEGKTIPINQTGIAEYSFNAPIPGSHKIPVRLTYSDQDGNIRVFDRVLPYTV